MRIISLFLIITVFASCGGSAVTKKLSSADSLVVTFNKPGTDSVINMVNTTEKNAIKKMAGFFDGKEAKEYKCGYDGSMVFFQKGKPIVSAVFKYSDKDCRHFFFDMDNKVMTTEMGNEAADFLKDMAGKQ